ncbi:MAG: protoheme IX farnesyltransferase [Rhizobiales bacterium NRL2]|jgi:protoheme IX farnesyltransferase|nr:MAG: protoheme IX farnesyltransferase [Rhizobiales bacterium NRL2]
MSDAAYAAKNEATRATEARAVDFMRLLKPRVMSLVVFTSAVSLLAAPGSVHPVTALIAVICIAVGAGASGAINMWFDADIDAVMSRTAARPVPAGLVGRGDALVFGLFLAAASVFTMGLLVNLAAAAMLAFTIFFYAVIYTMWLKRLTPQNIVIGGAAGAFPPVIGWAAVTGDLAAPGAWALFAIIFLWTPPHFWALALYRSGDYARAGVPMLPVVAGEPATRRQILVYAVLLAPVALLPWVLGVGGALYLAVAVASSLVFIALAAVVWRQPTGFYEGAKRLFGYSILHLFALFAALGIEHAAGWV